MALTTVDGIMGGVLRRLLLTVSVFGLVFGAGVAPTVATEVRADGPDVGVSNGTIENSTAEVARDATNLVSADFDASQPGTAGANAASGGSNIGLTQRLRLVPDQPGVYGVTHRYRLPDQLRGLDVRLPAESTVVSATGFVRKEERTYEWDGSTERPRIEYRMAANRTVDQTGPIGGPGRLTFVDVGEWALVTRPGTSHSWSWSGSEDVDLDRSMEAAEGATGTTIAFLGAHEEYTHTAHGQEFRLIVPEAADLEEPPEELFAAFSDASDQLRVGDRDETVFVVAAPTPDGLTWGVRGLHTGGSDMWVRDFERLDEANNVWLHEYVHTRQGYVAADDARWFTEASAVYYAALLALEGERIGYEAFRERLAYGEGDYDGSVMAEPDTWQRNANYYVGALVAAELDRQIRLATDGETSLEAVFRRMNADGGTVTAAEFRSSLRATGGDDVARLGERYTTTTVRPTTWSADEHREAFGDGSVPTRVTYERSSEPDAVSVSGAYRNRSVDADALTLVPSERLSFDVVATNVGGSGGYEATLRVNDEPVAAQAGRLDSDESATLTFEHAFDRTGVYSLSVGEATLRVDVREPATSRVSNLTANRTTLPAGGSVGLSAAVENDADYPGEADLALTRNGTTFETRTVRLDAGESSTVEADVRLDEPGIYAFSVKNGPVEPLKVTVTESVGGGTDASTPGFEAMSGIAGVLATGAAAAVRAHRADRDDATEH
ncbi:M61 metallopeptidase family protein [Halobellus captivus]|uniref:hypothetical protein n=1 Tax=Halobellus captivus TaxID=2592614 RepID=UPI00119D8C55|nr:hypothetical protein [Halobellus captivus]